MSDSLVRSARSQFWKILFGLLWLPWLIPYSCCAGDLSVLLVLSDNATPYQTFATTFKQNLPANIRVSIQDHFESFSGNEQQIDLVVAVGANAGNWVAAHTSKPVLAAMLPSDKFVDLISKRHSASGLSAIFIDQPLERQASLIRAALPGRTRIGVLHSPQTSFDTVKLRKLLAVRDTTLIAQESSGALFDDLENLLSRSNVLLAVPDTAIYNANNFRNIMRSSYLHKIPLIGLSQSYVDAGAVCAVFSTVEQLAEQTRAAVNQFAQTRLLHEPKYPENFTIAVNRPMAQTLGIALLSPEAIREKMDKGQVEGR